MEQMEENKMIKCQFCGKEYMKNPYKYMDSLPEIFKKNLEYIPACNCLEENKIRELEELEKKRVQECMKNKMIKCQFCGKVYMKNPYKYMDSLPEIFKKNLEIYTSL